MLLKEQVAAQVDYCWVCAKEMLRMKNVQYDLSVIGSLPNPNVFIQDIANLLNNNHDLNKCIVVLLMKALVAKHTSRQDNVRLETELVHFYHYLSAHSPKVSEIVPANTNVGFSQHWHQNLNAQDCNNNTCIHECDVDETLR